MDRGEGLVLEELAIIFNRSNSALFAVTRGGSFRADVVTEQRQRNRRFLERREDVEGGFPIPPLNAVARN